MGRRKQRAKPHVANSLCQIYIVREKPDSGYVVAQHQWVTSVVNVANVNFSISNLKAVDTEDHVYIVFPPLQQSHQFYNCSKHVNWCWLGGYDRTQDHIALQGPLTTLNRKREHFNHIVHISRTVTSLTQLLELKVVGSCFTRLNRE